MTNEFEGVDIRAVVEKAVTDEIEKIAREVIENTPLTQAAPKLPIKSRVFGKSTTWTNREGKNKR